jgi:ketopantoate hydroxymethyltransferase
MKSTMTRKQRLVAMRVAGYHGDTRTFTRLYIEGRVSMPAAQEAYAQGVKAKEAGVPCSCFECKEAAPQAQA